MQQDWFLARVRQVDRCWEWQSGRTKGGYGTAVFAGKSVPAHRLAYELFVGPIPRGMEIDHRCENAPCVFPPHLDVVTRRENMDRHSLAFQLRQRLEHLGQVVVESTIWRDEVRRAAESDGPPSSDAEGNIWEHRLRIVCTSAHQATESGHIAPSIRSTVELAERLFGPYPPGGWDGSVWVPPSDLGQM